MASKVISLQTVQRNLQGFDDNLVYYVYLKLNKRDEEAEQFLDEYSEPFKNLSAHTVEEDVNKQQHAPPLTNDKPEV